MCIRDRSSGSGRARRRGDRSSREKIDPLSDELYRYLNFDQISGFEDQGRVVSADDEATVLAQA